jgi:leader peptidase (prepilin peptidase)/N-methyltransferase
LNAILSGLFGLVIGSFLNVCVYRLPRDLSVVRPRSFCPGCGKGIAWFDNIPVLSFLFLRGRCRGCQTHIPLRYPLVELITGAAFFAAVRIYGATPRAATVCVFAAILVELSFSDLETRILPDEFTLGGAAVGLVFAWFVPVSSAPGLPSLTEALLAAVVASGALWLVGKLYRLIRHKEGLGGGDVRMVAMMGAFLGIEGVLLALILGSVLGAVIGLAYILLTSKDAGAYELPFGTFLGLGALAVALFGQPVLHWYATFGI